MKAIRTDNRTTPDTLEWVDRTGNTPRWTVTDTARGIVVNSMSIPTQAGGIYPRYVGVWTVTDTMGNTIAHGSTLYENTSNGVRVYRSTKNPPGGVDEHVEQLITGVLLMGANHTRNLATNGGGAVC